jgi:hypothetical protein
MYAFNMRHVVLAACSRGHCCARQTARAYLTISSSGYEFPARLSRCEASISSLESRTPNCTAFDAATDLATVASCAIDLRL